MSEVCVLVGSNLFFSFYCRRTLEVRSLKRWTTGITFRGDLTTSYTRSQVR